MPSQSLKYPLQSLFEPNNNFFLIINPDKDTPYTGGQVPKKKSTKQSSMTSNARTKLGGINIKRVLVHYSKLIQHFGSTKNSTQKAQTKYWGACHDKSTNKILWGACQASTTLVPNTNEKPQTNTGGHVKVKAQTNTGGMLGHYENQS